MASSSASSSSISTSNTFVWSDGEIRLLLESVRIFKPQKDAQGIDFESFGLLRVLGFKPILQVGLYHRKAMQCIHCIIYCSRVRRHSFAVLFLKMGADKKERSYGREFRLSVVKWVKDNNLTLASASRLF